MAWASEVNALADRKVAKKGAASQVAAKVAKPRTTAPKPQSGKAAKPALLSGGNPQIAKAKGDAAVEADIAAMPGWKLSRWVTRLRR